VERQQRTAHPNSKSSHPTSIGCVSKYKQAETEEYWTLLVHNQVGSRIVDMADNIDLESIPNQIGNGIVRYDGGQVVKVGNNALV
jgi:hypothetical protein